MLGVCRCSSVAAAGERAGEKEHGEREEDGEQAGEGGAALAALEGRARDVDAEAVARHDADHSCSAGMRAGMRRAIFIFYFYVEGPFYLFEFERSFRKVMFKLLQQDNSEC